MSGQTSRDVGTWAAVFSVVHVFVGPQVHARLRDFLNYFVADGRPLTNSFGLGNWTGLAAYTLLLLLSVIAILVGQAVGIWLWRRRHARTEANRRRVPPGDGRREVLKINDEWGATRPE